MDKSNLTERMKIDNMWINIFMSENNEYRNNWWSNKRLSFT